MKKIFIYIILPIIFIAQACNKDLGNYDYIDVNEVSVKVDQRFVAIKKDTTIVIRPEYSQTLNKNKENLEFVWTRSFNNNQNKGDTISTADTLVLNIDTKVEDFKYTYYIRLYVKDKTTNTTLMYPMTLSIKKPFEGSWMILHEKDGFAKLGNVEYFITGQSIKSDDVFFNSTQKHLSGKPVHMSIVQGSSSYWGFEASSKLFIYTTDPASSGLYNQADDFKFVGGANKLIAPTEQSFFDNSKVTGITNGYTHAIISNGNVFGGSQYGPRMYMVRPNDEVTAPLYITMGQNLGESQLFYDKAGNRLLAADLFYNFYQGLEWNYNSDFPYGEEYRPTLNLFNQNPKFPRFNPRNLGNKEVVYIGTGYHYGKNLMGGWRRISAYVVSVDKTESKLGIADIHAFVLASPDENDPDVVSKYFEIDLPQGFDETTPITSSLSYNNFVFFGIGNSIYRLDFASGSGMIEKIWTNSNPSAKVKIMQMAASGDTMGTPTDNYGHDLNRSLGAVFEIDGAHDEFVVLNLSNGGRIEEDGLHPAVQQYGGFGKIKNIGFILNAPAE